MPYKTANPLKVTEGLGNNIDNTQDFLGDNAGDIEDILGDPIDFLAHIIGENKNNLKMQLKLTYQNILNGQTSSDL